MDITDRGGIDDGVFILRFEAWEGPIEALLELAKTQKVDLAMIDLLDLVSQFDAVVGRALSLRLELAADWLVMAAWLTYLKSRLLLKRPKDRSRQIEDEDMLAFHLKRLNAVKTVAERLPAGLVLGRDWFAPSGAATRGVMGGVLPHDLHAFLAKYPRPKAQEAPTADEPPALKPFDLSSVDAALGFLERRMPDDWTDLLDLVPAAPGLRGRSNIATSLIASLEMTRDGVADIDQAEPYGRILVRKIAAR